MRAILCSTNEVSIAWTVTAAGSNFLTGTIGTFEKWAEDVGDLSWTWENILPYYKRSAHYTPANSELRLSNATIDTVDETASFAGYGGPLQVRSAKKSSSKLSNAVC